MPKPLVISILAKSNEAMLPLYLKSLMIQSEVLDPNNEIIFYIRTNDNNDNTAQILYDWYKKWNSKWKIYFDDSSINSELSTIENHDWTYNRFKILGDIRQKSVEFAKDQGADYFVADIDNIVGSDTISSLRSTNLPAIAPLLRTPEWSAYSNFHADIDENGYYKPHDIYLKLLNQEIKGIIEVPVIHCTYLIKNEYLEYVKYDDLSGRFEYVIFSDSLRKSAIPQYLDTRKCYGVVTFSSSIEEIESNRIHPAFSVLEEYINKTAKEKWQIQ
jgi:hypothetical protein